MEEKQHKVHIVTWPKEPARLKHSFESNEPCPVSVKFEKDPANVVVSTTPENPLAVNMDMSVKAREAIPICIKVCEPICARSDYFIGITIFDRPTAGINVRGETRIVNCREDDKPRRICMNFQEFKGGEFFAAPFTHHDLTFAPLGAQLRTVTFGAPAGTVKLAFPKEGVRVEFPGAVNNIRLTLNNYSGPTLDVTAFSGSAAAEHITVPIQNEVREVNLSASGVTSVEIKGGNNEAAIVEICYEILKK